MLALARTGKRPDTMSCEQASIEDGCRRGRGSSRDGRAAGAWRSPRPRVTCARPRPARPRARRALDPRHRSRVGLAAADRARGDRARRPDDALPHRSPARRGAPDQPRGRRRRPARRARRGHSGRRRARTNAPRAAPREPRRTPGRLARRRSFSAARGAAGARGAGRGLRPTRSDLVRAREPRGDRAPDVRRRSRTRTTAAGTRARASRCIGPGCRRSRRAGWSTRCSGSGTVLGLVVALQMVPVLFLAPYAGVIADRVDKRRLIIAVRP